MGRIFICYRRQDSQDMAGRIYDRLETQFGSERIFKDVDSLSYGERFPDKVRAAIAESDVFLALIGERWLDACDSQGNRRLDDAGDYVRLEIEEALRQGIAAVPVLLYQAAMPSKKELPASCSDLAEIHALRVRPDPDFKHDVGRLLNTVATIVADRERELSEAKAQAARDLAQREHVERELAQREHAEQERLAAESRQAEQEERAKLQSAREQAERQRQARELAQQQRAEQQRLTASRSDREPVAPVAAASPPRPPHGRRKLVRNVAAAGSLLLLLGISVWAYSQWPKKMELLYIPAGEFMMGSPPGEQARGENEGPQHRVRITKPFYLSKTEVTQSQWEAVMHTTPWDGGSGKSGANYPARSVNWMDAVYFCEQLSQIENRHYRLPTEAEWEFACRADATTSYSFGDDASMLGDFAWYSGNSESWAYGLYPRVVGQTRANPLGVCDMHGNTWEWCADWYDKDYYAQSPTDDPQGPAMGTQRVLRGGSYYVSADLCRSASRNSNVPISSDYTIGFRVACDAP